MSNKRGKQRGQSTLSDSCCKCKKGNEVENNWVQCDICDQWYHNQCSGLSVDSLSVISEAKFLLYRCENCFSTNLLKETSRKVISDILSELLPEMISKTLNTVNFDDLVYNVKQLQVDVNQMKHKQSKSYSQSISGTLATQNVQKPIPNQSSNLNVAIVSKPMPSSGTDINTDWQKPKTRRPVKTGTVTGATFSGVHKPNPRKHLYIGRVPNDTTEDAIKTHCSSKSLNLLAIRMVSKTDAPWKSFHCVFDSECADLEDPNLWPENVVIGRFGLNDAARTWLKTLPQPKAK